MARCGTGGAAGAVTGADMAGALFGASALRTSFAGFAAGLATAFGVAEAVGFAADLGGGVNFGLTGGDLVVVEGLLMVLAGFDFKDAALAGVDFGGSLIFFVIAFNAPSAKYSQSRRD